MLERVEVLEGARRHLRRGVRLACEVASDYWDDLVSHRLVDLSPSGGFIESPLPLEPGEELEVGFCAPRSRSLYFLRARVVRSSLGRRCAKRDVPGMGIEFVDLTSAEREGLANQLVGIPPRFPIARKKHSPKSARGASSLRVVGHDLVWVEEIFEDEPIRGSIAMLDGVEMRALAPILY